MVIGVQCLQGCHVLIEVEAIDQGAHLRNEIGMLGVFTADLIELDLDCPDVADLPKPDQLLDMFHRRSRSRIGLPARQHGLVIIADEIYDKLLLDPADEHVSIAALAPDVPVVTLGGLSKNYLVPGWRVGWAIAPPDLSSAIRKVHDFLTVGAAAPLQEASALALSFGEDYYRQLGAEYSERRAIILTILERAGFQCYRPKGAYYVMTDISRFGFADDITFVRYLIETIGVAAVPGSSFYQNPFDGSQQIRFCFCKKYETLKSAGKKLLHLSPQ